MDKYLRENEIKLHNLLEQKDFDKLSVDEKSFVLSQITSEDYQLHRNIIKESASLYDDHEKLTAPPLILAREGKSFWFKSLPLYQTGIAVAAVALIMWFIKLPKDEIIKTEVKTEYISKVDTLVKTEYVHDTIYEIIEKPVVIKKVTYVEAPTPSSASTDDNNYTDSKRELNPSGPYPIPVIGVDKQSASSSFANDETAVLVPELILND